HPVEPRGLQPVEPALRDLRVARRGRDRERQRLQELPPLLERTPAPRPPLPDEDVERDELGGDLAGEPADPRLGGVEAHLHRVEVEAAAPLDHDLAVERRALREQLAERPELREVAQQGALVAAPQPELTAVVLEHPAKAVPLRLVLPALADGELAHELGLHRRERDTLCGHCPPKTSAARAPGAT